MHVREGENSGMSGAVERAECVHSYLIYVHPTFFCIFIVHFCSVTHSRILTER